MNHKKIIYVIMFLCAGIYFSATGFAEIAVTPGSEEIAVVSQLKAIIKDYYDAFDRKDFEKWQSYFTQDYLSTPDGRYSAYEGKSMLSENLYIRTLVNLDSAVFETRQAAPYVTFWQARAYVSKAGLITTTENKVALTFKKEGDGWKIAGEIQLLGKDNLALHKADDLLAENKIEEAIRKYQDVLAVNPWLSSAHLGLMYAYEITNRMDDAESAIQKAIDLRPDIAAYHYLLAKIYQIRKKPEESKAEFRKVADLDAGFPGVAQELQK